MQTIKMKLDSKEQLSIEMPKARYIRTIESATKGQNKKISLSVVDEDDHDQTEVDFHHFMLNKGKIVKEEEDYSEQEKLPKLKDSNEKNRQS